MKKTIIVVSLLIGSVAIAAAPLIPKDWRDLLSIKPSYEWQQLYGFGSASFLAHGQETIKKLLDGQGKVIENVKKIQKAQGELVSAMKKEIDALKARVEELKPKDPNEVIKSKEEQSKGQYTDP